MGNNLTFTFACYDDFEAIHNTRWWSETEQHRWEIQGGEFSSGLVIDHEATRKSDKARTIIAKDYEGTVHTATWNPEATEIVWTDGDVWKRLDWICLSCHRENFVDATVCRVCGAPRGQKYTDNAAARYHGNAEMLAKLKGASVGNGTRSDNSDEEPAASTSSSSAQGPQGSGSQSESQSLSSGIVQPRGLLAKAKAKAAAQAAKAKEAAKAKAAEKTKGSSEDQSRSED